MNSGTYGAGPAPDSEADVGLATERTSLAWQRTAIAQLVAGLVLVRALIDSGWFVVPALLLTAAGSVAAWSSSRVDVTIERRRRSSTLLAACTTCTAAACAVGVLVLPAG